MSAQLSRNAFLKCVVVFLGPGGALASACTGQDPILVSNSPTSPGSSANPPTGSSPNSDASTDAGAEAGADAAADTQIDTGTDPSLLACRNHGAHDSHITNNHGHELLIPAADFATPTGGTYDILGAAAHSHTVTLSGAQLTAISQGTAVTVTSSFSTHAHDVTIVCA